MKILNLPHPCWGRGFGDEGRGGGGGGGSDFIEYKLARQVKILNLPHPCWSGGGGEGVFRFYKVQAC